MTHGKKLRKFSRTTKHRKALFVNLVKALIRSEQIMTTLHKAKDLRPVVEKIITLGKRGDLAARRQAISFLRGDCPEVAKLFSKISDMCKSRQGGYTRILKAGFRKGDSAPMAIIELVDRAPAVDSSK
jgi:large subunit ribosomal protein L17